MTEETSTPTAHAAVTRGLERALRDLGVDLVGCPPSVLSGHVIKELREGGLLRTPVPEEVRKSAIEALAAAFHARDCDREDCGDCGKDCHDDAVLAVDTLISAGSLAALIEDEATPKLITIEGTSFPGCTDMNPDNCVCAQWVPIECMACAEDIVDGQQAYTLTIRGRPYLGADHPEQEWETLYWHVECDQRAARGPSPGYSSRPDLDEPPTGEGRPGTAVSNAPTSKPATRWSPSPGW